MQNGLLIVVSAPSGAGKRTVLQRLAETESGLATTVSATTRAPRAGEIEGRDYYFLSREVFDRRVTAGDFVEWAEVHGHRYGTLQSELDRLTASGKDVVIEIDVQGMRNLRTLRKDMISVFIVAPSQAELERRLRERGTNSQEDIALRLRNAEMEMAGRHEYDYIVINDELDRAAADLRAILRAEHCRAERQ